MQYPNPDKHYQQYIDKAAKRYVEGLELANLEPSAILTRRMAERAHNEAQADFIAQSENVHAHNVSTIVERHKRNMRALDIEGAKTALWLAPFMIFCFAVALWFSLSSSGIASIILSALYVMAILIFMSFFVRSIVILMKEKKHG